MTSSFGIIGIVLVVILQAKNGAAQDTSTYASSYEVEGCYSEFIHLLENDMGDDNSNVLCQDVCRGQGFALAATYNGHICECGNIYPTGKEVGDDKCNSKCVSYMECSSVQECCGGADSYTVSMVGDVDIALQVLRRMSNVWVNNEGYRTNMINHMKDNSDVSAPKRYLKDWNGGDSNFNEAGWSTCGVNEYMTGLDRAAYDKNDDGIYRLEAAQCSLADIKVGYPSNSVCREQDWNGNPNFNEMGWSRCHTGYFLHGLERSSSEHWLHNIETASCCKPPNAQEKWGDCYEKDVTTAFNDKGTQSCDNNYFLAGLYRDSCHELYCLQRFLCCKMAGPIDDSNSWMENPYFTINTQTADGNLERCSMRAMDITASSDSYKCQDVSNENMLDLQATSFEIQDETPLNTEEPSPIPGLLPAVCLPSSGTYQCKKDLTTSITQSSTLTIGTGFQLGVEIGASVEVTSKFFGTGITSSFQSAVSSSTSFNVEGSKTTETTTSESTTVTVEVPPQTQVTINMLRATVNMEYRWKGIFEVIGKYFAVWDNEYEYMQDITTVLTGDDLNTLSFGLWSYPATDVVEVVVTDQYGNEAEGCESPVGGDGGTNDCTMDAPRKLASKSKDIKEEL